MTLVDRYLKAVASQLPPEGRDDITAELRDEIETRLEARAAELGRPLKDPDIEAVLREIGHPLTVAARYRPGPQHLIGPELYPYWLFAVKAGAGIIALVTAVTAMMRLAGGHAFADVLADSIHGLINGGITLVGIATVVGFVIERQAEKPRFLREWRVKDLGMLDLGAWDETVFGAGGVERRPAIRGRSPVANAIVAAVFWTLFLLWWLGALTISGGTWDMEAARWGGVDWRAFWIEARSALYAPVIGYSLGAIGLALSRATQPGAVRLHGAGEAGLAAVRLGLLAWVWFSSSLGPLVRFDSVAEFSERMAMFFTAPDGWMRLPALLTIIVVFWFGEAAGSLLVGLWRLATGRPRRG
jgi:hypothetical protein